MRKNECAGINKKPSVKWSEAGVNGGDGKLEWAVRRTRMKRAKTIR